MFLNESGKSFAFFLCDETCWLVISMFTWHTIIFSRINLLKVMKFLLKTVVCWYFSWYHHECNQFKFQQSTVQLVTAVQQETIIYHSQSDDVMTQLNCINHLVHGCANMSYPGPNSLVNISLQCMLDWDIIVLVANMKHLLHEVSKDMFH